MIEFRIIYFLDWIYLIHLIQDIIQPHGMLHFIHGIRLASDALICLGKIDRLLLSRINAACDEMRGLGIIELLADLDAVSNKLFSKRKGLMTISTIKRLICARLIFDKLKTIPFNTLLHSKWDN